ncbi:diaminopimelate epimerase, partial [Wolbachia endosymbiont of Pentidionis agamae]
MKLQVPFFKMHGTGNDFVIIDSRCIAFTNLDYIKIANRKIGIGCDQVIIIEASSKADCFMRIYNRDGSEAEICGNAARCVSYFIMVEKNIDFVTIELLNDRILECFKIDKKSIKINMG